MSTATEGSVPNLASLSDDQITEKVCKTHVPDPSGEKLEVGPLWNVVYNIVKGATRIADSLIKGTAAPIEHMENKGPILYSLNSPFRVMKQIAIQMMEEAQCKGSADKTTMWILEKLKSYAWNAKVVLTLAAFALNYGNFWLLTQISLTTDSFGNQLALLNQAAIVNDPQSNDALKLPIYEVNSLIKILLQVIEFIIELETLSSKGYDTNEVTELVDAMHDIPLVAYWAINSIVACAAQLEFLMGFSDYHVILDQYVNKIASIHMKLEDHLANIEYQIEEVEDYLRHKKVFQTPTEVVELLKILIYSNNTQDHQVFDGTLKKMVSIEVLRQKHTFLFISSLDSIRDEIMLLESIHEGLMEDPKEVKGYKKKDFKILWIPIVDDWNIMQKVNFTIWKSKMPWYVVEYFWPLAGIKLIREVFGYKNKPIVLLMNPQGKIINSNALHMMFVWGMEAFPFRLEDDENLSQKSRWFWSPIIKIFQPIRGWIKEDKYIFIYGGTPEWMESFEKAVQAIKVHENLKNVDATIEHYPLGKNDPKYANQFWDNMESLFQIKLLKKPHSSVLHDVLEVLCLKHDCKGWIVLSRGSNIKLLGQADPALHTAEKFEEWKNQVLEKVGFDVAFREFYEKKLKEGLPNCAFMQLENFPSNVLEPISCPDLKCGRLMDVANVSYKCCHGCKPNELEEEVYLFEEPLNMDKLFELAKNVENDWKKNYAQTSSDHKPKKPLRKRKHHSIFVTENLGQPLSISKQVDAQDKQTIDQMFKEHTGGLSSVIEQLKKQNEAHKNERNKEKGKKHVVGESPLDKMTEDTKSVEVQNAWFKLASERRISYWSIQDVNKRQYPLNKVLAELVPIFPEQQSSESSLVIDSVQYKNACYVNFAAGQLLFPKDIYDYEKYIDTHSLYSFSAQNIGNKIRSLTQDLIIHKRIKVYEDFYTKHRNKDFDKLERIEEEYNWLKSLYEESRKELSECKNLVVDKDAKVKDLENQLGKLQHVVSAFIKHGDLKQKMVDELMEEFDLLEKDRLTLNERYVAEVSSLNSALEKSKVEQEEICKLAGESYHKGFDIACGQLVLLCPEAIGHIDNMDRYKTIEDFRHEEEERGDDREEHIPIEFE